MLWGRCCLPVLVARLPPANKASILPDETIENPPELEFMAVLEDGVRAVLKSKKATPQERVAAITAGAKLMMIKHKISGSDEKGFFE